MSPEFSATMTSEDLDRDAAGAEKAAESGPVLVTDGGEPAFVLLSFADYRRLVAQRPGQRSLIDVLADTEGQDFDFNPDKAEMRLLPRLGD